MIVILACAFAFLMVGFQVQTSPLRKNESIPQNPSSNCHTVPFDEVVTFNNCSSLTIKNRYCSGSCPSYYIPGMTESYTDCTACFPQHTENREEIFECMSGDKIVKMKKMVRYLINCTCSKVGCMRK